MHTTLENFAMPVIRYRVGDRGKIQSKVVCECLADILDDAGKALEEQAKLPEG